jgi:hypothetical protein
VGEAGAWAMLFSSSKRTVRDLNVLFRVIGVLPLWRLRCGFPQ